MGPERAWTAAGAAFVVVAVVAAGVAPAHAEPAVVPLLLVEPPADFDAARFATALETYVSNARIAVSARAGAGVDAAAVCADAQAAARAVASPIALWVRWRDGALVIERVGEAGCGAIESSVVDVAPDQQAFLYRVAALKVASLVREVPAPAQEPAVVVVAPPPVAEGPPVPVPAATAEPSAIRTVELGASGIASTEAADRVTLACLGGWVGGAAGWAFGGSVMISAAEDEADPGGHGSAQVFGAFAGLRRAVVRGPRWQLDVSAELGVLGVGSSATRTGTSVEMSTRVWTPAVAFAPRLRVPLAGPLALAVGPTLEGSTRPVRLSLGDTPLYNASRLRLRWDVRAELHF